MTVELAVERLPLATDADGVIRVGSTRVTLDNVVGAYADGVTAEGIIEQYPSLNLADVYLTIGYYLSHRSEVETYLKNRRDQSEAVRKENEARFDPAGIRQRLLSRRKTG